MYNSSVNLKYTPTTQYQSEHHTSQNYQVFKTILTSVCHTILTPQPTKDHAMTQLLTEGFVDTILHNNPQWWTETV